MSRDLRTWKLGQPYVERCGCAFSAKHERVRYCDGHRPDAQQRKRLHKALKAIGPRWP